MRLGVRESLIAGRRVAGDVIVEDGVIVAVGAAPAGPRHVAVPGFIDVQVNGFAGVDFSTCDVDGYRVAAAGMAATGVTAYQPTYICMPEDAYRPALAVAAQAQREVPGPRLLGVHLEGPFLSPTRIGAHDPANTRVPDAAWAADIVAAGPVTYATIAPELPGAVDLIRRFTAAGIIVALGHSDADVAIANAGFDAGAQAVTHLFNAQRPWQHRDPGIAGVALVRDDVTVTLILDGHHLAAETVEIIRRCAHGRIALITDAISAAGRPDGSYALGDRRVIVDGGAARLDDGTLAGSTLTMDAAIRSFIDLGATVGEAIGAATEVPGRLLGLGVLGAIEIGAPADVTVLDDDLEVMRTLVAGHEVYAR